MSKYVTAAEAVKVVKSGDRVYLQAAAAGCYRRGPGSSTATWSDAPQGRS